MTPASACRFVSLMLLFAAGLPACRRGEPAASAPASPPVSPELRAVVGRQLSIDASQIDPDLSLVAVRPDIKDVDVVWLTLGLEEAFSVDITPEASFEIIGARTHQAPLKLTLRNVARLIASAPHAEHPPAPPPPPRADAAASDDDETPEPPTLVRGAYVFACPLAGLDSPRVRVDRKSRLSLLAGRRKLDEVSLDGDFFGADAEVQCGHGYVTIRRKQGNGRDRVLSYAWRAGRLQLNLKGNEIP